MKKCPKKQTVECVWCFRTGLSLCSCSALPAAVSEWRIWGEPRAVSQSSAERRHHFPQPHEEQPYARAQHHQWQCRALTLSVHQQHAPSVVGYSQPARWEAMWVLILHVSTDAFTWLRSLTHYILFYIPSVLRRPTRQASPGAWCSGCSQRSARWAQRETASCSRGSGETEANSACTKTGDHEAEEAGDEESSPLSKSGIRKPFTHRCLGFNCRSIWKCKDSWPSSASRSRRRRGRCVWSSRSTPSRWGPKCLLSLFPMPRYTHLSDI